MRLACAFNQNFVSGDLEIQNEVSMIEIGVEGYNHITKRGYPGAFESYKGTYSIHVARSPITEHGDAQDAFISEVIPDVKDAPKVVSCGFHLCGHRHANIGRYGFTTHYECSPEAERNAIEFIEKVKKISEKDVWIENANFYSPDGPSLVRNLESTMRIANEADAGIILDLAHMAIDARNNGLDPRLLVGFVAWECVTELHLSGIIKGRDGALHDGHSKAVDLECWELFGDLTSLGVVEDDVYINIEHSDDTWRRNHVEYEKDFSTCLEMMHQGPVENQYSANSDDYARSYLSATLKRVVANMSDICEALGRSEDRVINDWFQYLEQNDLSLAFTPSEIDSVAAHQTAVYTDAFAKFVEEECG